MAEGARARAALSPIARRIAVIALAAGPCLGAGGAIDAQNARRDDTKERFSGVAVADPYRWLETGGQPDTVAWEGEQRRATEGLFDRMTEAAGVRARLRALVPTVRIEDARGVPGGYLYRVADIDSGERTWRYTAVDRKDSSKSWSSAAGASDVVVSPDGRRVALVRTANAGSSRIDVASVDEPPVVLTSVDASGPSVAWLPDSSSLVFVRHTRTSSGRGPAREVCVATVSVARTATCRGAVEGDGDVTVAVSADGSLGIFQRDVPLPDGPAPAFIGFQQPVERPRTEIWTFTIREGIDELRRLAIRGHHQLRFLRTAGRSLLFLASNAAGRRVIAVDAGESADARDVLTAAADQTLNGAASVEAGLVVDLTDLTHSTLRLFAPDGQLVRDFALPEPGVVSSLSATADGAKVLFRFGSFVREPSFFVGDPTTGMVQEVVALERAVDPSAFVTSNVEYPAADGTSIPMLLVHRRDRVPGPDVPTLLYVYGAYGWVQRPAYHQRWFAWIDHGGVLAVAYVRGDGIRGQPWHDAGRGLRKPNAVADSVAAARWLVARGLVARGLASPRRLGIHGLSAGGAVAGAALLTAPSLFGAALLEVPAADLIRGGFPESEFGPMDEAGVRRRLSLSPYHLAIGGRGCLPPTFVLTSDDDAGVGFARKFTAALQAHQTCDAPVALRIGSGEGHLPTGLRGWERHAAEVAFLAWALHGDRQ